MCCPAAAPPRGITNFSALTDLRIEALWRRLERIKAAYPPSPEDEKSAERRRMKRTKQQQRRIAVEQVAREQSEREVAVALARSRCAACNGAHRSHTCGVSAAERNAANYSAAVVMEAAAAAVPEAPP
mgnify:CR=1 FL=1